MTIFNCYSRDILYTLDRTVGWYPAADALAGGLRDWEGACRPGDRRTR